MSTETLSREALLRAALLKKIQQQSQGVAPIVPGPRPAHVPLSLAQQRLWFMCELDPAASQASHISSALRLAGQLDRGALEHAFAQLIARHESLRTHFAQVNGVPCQVVAEDLGGFTLSCRDLRGEADADARLSAELADSVQQPFDLARGPLLRVGLWRMRDDEYVLLITMHHLITDGWSLGVLVRELAGLYTATCEGRALQLPPLPIQYADYAIWQRGEYSGEALEKQLAFWRSLLGGAPEGVELPTDRPRPTIQSHRGGSLPIALPETLSRDLRTFAASTGVTPFMVLLAAWALWLARRSGQDDIVVGSPVAGRTRREIEGLIGFFVNTLALRVHLPQDLTVADLLAQVKETTLSAFAHQAVPFEQVVDAVRPARSLGRSPLFQTMVALNNTPDAGELSLPGLTLSPCATPHTTTHFELSLALSDGGGALSGAIEYASDLFDEETVHTFAQEWQRLLAGMLANQAAEVWELPLLSGEASNRLWQLQNDTAIPYAQESLLHSHFEARAAERPDAEALVCGERRLTYRELDEQANRLAAHLREQGVPAGARVALCLPRGVEMIVAMLAVLKAGAIYVPLDPEYPSERLLHILQDATPQLVLRRQQDDTLLPDGDWAVLEWERLPWTAPATALAQAGCNAESLCCLIYTSGSTGRPKGVMLRHRNLVNLATSTLPIAFAPGMRLAHAANVAFDAASWEIWGALSNGACLVVVSADELLDAERLSALLAREQVDVLHLTVGLFHQHAEAMAPAFSRLSALLFGGEKADAQKVRRLLSSGHAPPRLVQCYGPTETTTFASCELIEALPSAAKTVPLGRPLANMRLYVLDGRGQPVPEGVVGEIYIAGAGVSAGYWQNDALTLERFMPDPRGETPEARMYRTGDLARRLADGRLEYMGRNDFQLKIRGYRIEPAEIEAALCACEGVREAVVIAREDVPGDKRLVAYLRCEDSVTAEHVRASLASRLPEYMLPSAYVQMAEWPLTAHGKLDRSALPAPQQEARAARTYRAPDGEIEQSLAGIWQGLLGIERVGRDDHFFELGGHSLLAVQVVSHVRERLGVEVPLRELFARPVLHAFAQAVRDAGSSTLGRIERVDRDRPLPLSLSQQRLWFIDQLDPAASRAYHMPAALRLIGRLDRSALKQALDALVARQEGLRARLVSVDGVPHQVFAPEDAGFALQELDLTVLADDAREQAIAGHATDEAGAPFDFARGPLIRGRLLRTGEDEHVLLITQHHIVSDGWSSGVMVREFATLYAAFCEGRPNPLPPLEIQYADYAVWQRGWLQGEELERQTSFWRDHLVGAPALLELPTDRPRPAVQSHVGGTLPFALPDALTAQLRQLAQRQGTTLFMVLLAGWSLLLSRLSGQDDVVVGTPVANRQRREVEDLIGFFVNTLALRVRVGDAVSVSDLLSQVKETTLGAFAHQELPFEQVVEAVQPVRSLSHSPLFQVMLSLDNTPEDGTLALPGLTLAPVSSDRAVAQFDLSLSLTDAGPSIHGNLKYASDLFDRTTIERFAGHFIILLEGMAADATASPAALPIMTAAQRTQVLEGFNATAAEYPQDALIHALFERQAAAQPDAVAVVCGASSLRYGELNARANRIAHYLIAQGVQADDRVAICVERSVDTVAGLLGILKAGGAYMPLDPDHPPERLGFMLEDSAPKHLLTQSSVRDRLPASAVPQLVLDDCEAVLSGYPGHDPDARARGASSRQLIYMIYTSGSTGAPKGVMVEHRSVVNLWLSLERRIFGGLARTARVGLNASITFDSSVKSLTQLLSGRTLVIFPQDIRQDSAALLAYLREHQVDAFDCTPAQLEMLLGAGFASSVETGAKTVLIGGEAISVSLWERLRQIEGVEFHNVYGPTECTVDATACALDEVEVPSIGKPLSNVKVYVLDAQGEPVPVGVSGELYIGGDGVARGYLNRPELTAERFVRDPFSADPQARMYRTGDLGRWLPDGNIEYLGRNDFQVKIRGFRIELGEIEARLAACDGVREAVVLAREDVPGDKRLVAYLTSDRELPVAELRAHLLVQLPDYMVPSAFVVLEAFPLTPNGKLDRKALPAPDGASLSLREYEAPQGAIEQGLAEIWQSLLKVEQVGRHDHFFELGGHSLLAVQVVSHVRERLGMEVPLRALFVHPVLHAFAHAVAQAGASTLGRIERVDRDRPLPLSLSQQRLWFIDRLDPAASRAYHMASALRLTGDLDRDALKRALDTLVARQEGLRARLVAVDGVPHQVFAPEDAGFALQELDLSSLADDARERAIVEHATDEAAAPFDLSRGSLIRGRLLRTGEDEHVLLITQHHIVSDGWSIGVIIREFATLYTVYCEGRPNPLPPLEIQYADYAVWQRGWLQGEELERQTSFWRDHLVGAPALLELPTDRPRPAVQGYAGAVVPVALSAELAGRLRALAQSHGTTLFTVLLAGWSLLLSRLSGQDDVVVGVPVANRQRREVEALVGFFVNTLALRTRFAEPMTVAGLLAQVRETTLGAFAHQELPFEQVVEAVQPVRSLSHSPLFQVMLSLNNTPGGDALDLPGLTLSQVQGEHTIAQFDLSLSLNDGGAGLHGGIDYAVALFDRSTIERLVGHFVTLLEAMSASDAQPIATLPIMTDAQRSQVVKGFNATSADYPKDALIHELFERQAAAQPDAVAVVCGESSLRYGELNARANQLAHELVARGVRPDDRVAICVERGLEMIVGLLAILKAGGAYVPLDPVYPVERLTYMLEDSAPVVLLAHAALAQRLPDHGVPTLCLDTGDAQVSLAARPTHNPDTRGHGLTARHLAYVIYTSGSTGQPKGVMVEHASATNLILSHCAYCGLVDSDRVLQFASFAFDASVEEIFPALCVGASIVVRPAELSLDGPSFSAYLDRFGVTVAELPTAFWHLWAQSVDTIACSALRLVVVGGEKAERRVLQAWTRAGGMANRRWLNTYGPTESTVYSVAIVFDEATPLPDSEIPIGRPIANTQVYILNAQGEPVPVGVSGEIHIGGDGVARGYLNRPELTAERFVRDPFSADPQARMYRTGDLGRWLPDGNIEYLGRNDFQVKIRGFRIELGEIEARLAACDGVREAVVLAREDVPGDKRLVAYVTPAPGAEIAVAEVRARLSTQLPDYMVPSAFVVLEAFPLTPNGKLDRKALPAPDGASLSRREYEAPQGAIEQGLAEIWQSLLKVEQVGRQDDFFELGGHSLLAVQVVSHVRERLGVDVALRELFVHPALHAFAEAVAQAGASTLGRIERVDRDRPLPLSLSQQRLWFIDQLDPAASRAYHMPAALRLSGQLDRAALKAALDLVLARQEGLRARIIAVDGVPHQVFAPEDIGFALAEHDVSGMPGEAREEAVREHVEAEAMLPFDFARGPLIRGRLLRTGEDEHVLLITQHHIVSDGWSSGVMVREFATLYAAFCEGRANPLPPLEIQYADYAVWQRGWLQGEELERQTSFWRDHLVGAPALLELPTDRPRPAVQSHVGGTLPFALPDALTAQLRQLAQRQGTTLFMVLLAGWSLLLSRLSGQDDVVVGTPVANRQRREVEDLIGFFVNTLALRVRVGDAVSVSDLLSQVKETTLGAFAHQELPFEQVVEAVQPVRSLSHSPLFQVMLSLDNTPEDGTLALPGLTLAPVSSDRAVAQFDLSLSLTDAGPSIHGNLKYASDLFDRTTIERFAGHFIILLEGMAADATASPAALPIMTAAQRTQVLEGFNATAAEYPQDALIHALFERQAAAQPDAVAVVCGASSLRYGELNARANRIAHYLIAQGVQADDRVAICVERSVDTVAGLLGILKAGGAYMPLDPDHPPERLGFMLEDSAPKHLLTQSSVRDRLPASAVPQLVLDDCEAVLSGYPGHDPDARARGASSRQLIYMIYTSGSTGAPKGVMVEHRQVMNLWSSLERKVFPGLMKTARVGLNASITFDASVQSLTQLLSGRTLVIFPQDIRQDSAALLAYLREHQVDAFDCTPVQLEMLLDAGFASSVETGAKTVLIGGEAISVSLWERLRRIDGVEFHNVYGPTECTVDATACALDKVEVPSIGKPLSNMKIYVLDAQGAPVPVGVSGELYIGGDGVARGYLNRPELTAERFVRDPFSADPQARMYRTGDLGRWLPDGNIEYLGRNDFQVKIRGFRIELGEIEARLAACDGVREAVVLAREDVPGDKRLVAYLTPAPGAEIAVAEVRARLSTQLPDYMVPSAFVVLEAFPLTPNGKLDRKALPAPDGASLSRREYEAPQGAIEQGLAEIWQSLLKVEQVGRHDHFFELGGHSLLAVQVVSHVRERLGIELALRELFMHSTLSALAARMMANASARPWSPLVPLKSRPGRPTLYMVPGVAMTAGSLWDLAQSLDGRMNVHVLEAIGLEEGQKPSKRMEDIVDMNLSAMRETGIPEGPIVLAGHSFGGSVAFEMARALEQTGHRVQLLLIDNLLVLPKHLRKVKKEDLGILGTDKRLKNLFEAQRDIYKRYEPSGRFYGTVEVIYARDGEIKSMPERDRLQACRKYCAQAPVVSWVGGDHRSMLGAEHADELSEVIWQAWRRYLDRSEVIAH